MNKKLFAFIAVAAAILTSCAGDEVLTDISEPKEILFSVSEAGLETRAGTTTDNITDFGISISNPVASQYTYNNVKVEKASTKWTPAQQLLWHNLTDTVDIVAMSPYSSTAVNLCGISNYAVSVKADQTKGLEASDLLAWKATALVPERDLNSDGTLDIQFQHLMCQLNIVVVFDQNLDSEYLKSNPIQSLSVIGTKLNGTCNFTAATPTVKETGTSGTIYAQESQAFVAKTEGQTAKAYYSCLIVPQSIGSGGFRIKLNVNGANGETQNYLWTLKNSNKFEAGRTYTVTLSNFSPK
jgi:hypothetical protein